MRNFPVLLFHSIDDRDLLSLNDLGNIRPELFGKLIVELKKEFNIVSLDEIVRNISGDINSGERLLALTFDDGPKSYATQALPVLEAHGLPSACFLITDCIGDASIYWRYLYNFCINKGLSQELAGLINAEYAANIRAEEIISFSRNCYNRTRNGRIIEKLLESVISEEEYRRAETDLFLSLEDIAKLKDNPLVSFGVHTCSHPVLKCLSAEEIHAEIAGSLDFYGRIIGDDAPIFSIPFGRLFRDYDERTIMIAKSLSLHVVLSAYGGGNEEDHPLYNVRRISVHEGKLSAGIEQFVETLHEPVVPGEYLEEERRLSELLSGRK